MEGLGFNFFGAVMLTEQQARLIEKCIADGFGTALFALSIRRQGSCTERQFITMQRLHSAAEYRRGNPQRRYGRQTRLDAAFADYGEGGDF